MHYLYMYVLAHTCHANLEIVIVDKEIDGVISHQVGLVRRQLLYGQHKLMKYATNASMRPKCRW